VDAVVGGKFTFLYIYIVIVVLLLWNRTHFWCNCEGWYCYSYKFVSQQQFEYLRHWTFAFEVWPFIVSHWFLLKRVKCFLFGIQGVLTCCSWHRVSQFIEWWSIQSGIKRLHFVGTRASSKLSSVPSISYSGLAADQPVESPYTCCNDERRRRWSGVRYCDIIPSLNYLFSLCIIILSINWLNVN